MAASSYTLGHLQSGDRRYVTETHTDDFGVTYVIEYLAGELTNYAAVMAARAVAIFAEKKAAEISRNISAITENGSLAQTVFMRSAKAENIGPLRDAFRNSGREATIMIADYLATLTDAQLRSIFGKTQAEVDTLRANRLTPAIALANSLRAAGGE